LPFRDFGKTRGCGNMEEGSGIGGKFVEDRRGEIQKFYDFWENSF
jgi:hypothetical protein